MKQQQDDADFSKQKNHVGNVKIFDRINESENARSDDDASNNFTEHCWDLDAFGKFGGKTRDKDDDEQVAENERQVVVASAGGDQTHVVILRVGVEGLRQQATKLPGQLPRD